MLRRGLEQTAPSTPAPQPITSHENLRGSDYYVN
jgi:hypothetical protein